MAIKEYPIKFPVELGGLQTATRAAMVYPKAVTASNVRWGLLGELQSRGGQSKYNATAMITTTENVTGLFQFNRRDTTTQYKIVCTKNRILSCPTSGAWTVLVSSMGSADTDYWDAAVFNNQLIMTNGVAAPQTTDGTVGGTGSLTARSWQTRTASVYAQGSSCGMNSVDGEGPLYDAEGNSVNPGAYHQQYDPSTDSWKSLTRATLKRILGSGASLYGNIYVFGGTSGAAVTAQCEAYKPETDAWFSTSAITTGEDETVCWGINSSAYVVSGTPDGTAGSATAKNQNYNPANDAWSAKTAISTARFQATSFNISQMGYIIGGRNTGNTRIATAEMYNPFSDSMGTAPASIGTATSEMAGAPGYGDGKGYVNGGDPSGSPTTASQSYNSVSNSWTAESNMSLTRNFHSCGISSYWIYVHGDSAGSNTSMERMNTSPAAPTAFYVETFRSQVFLARTSSFPSRVFYSVLGDSLQWPSFNFFDVNPDDGQWITGVFVFNGKMYICKTDTVYEVYGNVFDPGPQGDFGYVPLQNVPGAISNRSIVVTDQYVYYLAKDGIRVFDGYRSTKISNDIDTTLNGYTASRNKYVQGCWWRGRQEVLWAFSAGSAFDTIVSYNTLFKKFSTWTGHTPECLSKCEDANGVDQLLAGGVDGFIYTCDSGTQDNGADFTRTWTSGFFAPAGAFHDQVPGVLFWHTNRTTGGTMTFDFYRNFDSSTSNQTEAVVLDAANSSFLDAANDVRGIINLNVKNTGHHVQIKMTSTKDFVLQGLLYCARQGEISTLPGG